MSDSTEMWKRFLKYLLGFCFVSLVARYVPKESLHIKDVLIIGFSTSIVFGLLDIYSPAISFDTKKQISEHFK